MNDKMYMCNKEMVKLLREKRIVDMNIKDLVKTHFMLIEKKKHTNEKLAYLENNMNEIMNEIDELRKLNHLTSQKLVKQEEE